MYLEKTKMSYNLEQRNYIWRNISWWIYRYIYLNIVIVDTSTIKLAKLKVVWLRITLLFFLGGSQITIGRCHVKERGQNPFEPAWGEELGSFACLDAWKTYSVPLYNLSLTLMTRKGYIRWKSFTCGTYMMRCKVPRNISGEINWNRFSFFT
jgi:hypothetical protein